MQRIIVWVKSHPLLTAALAVGLFILVYLIMRSRGSASASGGVSIQGPSDAAIQAGVMSQSIEAASTAQMAHEQAMLTALNEMISGTLALTQLQGQTALTGQEQAIQGQESLQGMVLATQQTLGLANIAATTESERLRSETALSQTLLASTTATTLAQISQAGATTQSYIYADLQKGLAATQSQTFIESQKIQADVQRRQAELSASVAKSGQLWSFAGSVVGAAISDAKAKENIQPVADLGQGFRLWSFNRKGRAERQIGLVAQDVEKWHPSAVHFLQDGTRAVDYGKVLNIAMNHEYMMRGGYAA